MQLQQLISCGTGANSATAASAASAPSDATHSTAHKFLLGTVWSALGQQGKPGGVRDIVSALRSALVAGIASGQNVEPDLARTINGALSQAAQQLERQGVDPSHVDRMIARFRHDLSHGLDVAARIAGAGVTTSTSGSFGLTVSNTGGSASGTGSAGNSSISSISGSSSTNTWGGQATGGGNGKARFVDRESATLQIQTVEGDLVTLRFQDKTIASLPGAQTRGAFGGSSGAPTTVISRGQLQVEVRGNLNDSELRAVSDVLGQVDALATKFYSGDAQGAFAAAAGIGSDPAEIAGFSLQMSYSAQLYQPATRAVGPAGSGSVTQPTQPVQTPAASTQTPGTPPATVPVAPAPTAGTAPPTDSTAPVDSPAPPDSAVPADSSTATDGSGVTNPGATADAGSTSALSPRQAIASFVQDVLAKLGAGSRSSHNGISTRWKLEVLARALPAYAPSKTDAAKQAASLASATLGHLAT